MDFRKYDVELSKIEYRALLRNSMISLMFKDQLRSPKNSGEFVTLHMSESTLDSLAGFVAAEANHAETNADEQLLGSAFESLDATLNVIKTRGR